MGFLTEFNRCFKQGLEPYGFIKMRGCNIFGKLVNEEILKYIFFQKTSPFERGNQAFFLNAGIQTIYSAELTTSQLYSASRQLHIFAQLDSSLPNLHMESGLGRHYEYNEETCKSVLNQSLKDTVSVAIKYMSEVMDIKSYIEYAKKTTSYVFDYADEMRQDSILLIMTGNHETFCDVYDRLISHALKRYGDETHPGFIAAKGRINEVIFKDIVEPRDRVYQSPELMKQVEEELERRKEKNIELLKQYGLIGKNK